MKRTLRRGSWCVLLFALAGCSIVGENVMSTRRGETPSGPFGWISSQGTPVADDTTSRNIEFGHLDNGMNYYYSDSHLLPAAVIKLDKDYAMDDVHWKQITDPEMLIEVVQSMKVMDRTNGARTFRSFPVKAHDARPIGAWYSNKYVYGMRLNISPNKEVSLYVPNVVDTHTYYVKRETENLLSQGMPSFPEMHRADEISTEAPM
jgi:hypothetical protein